MALDTLQITKKVQKVNNEPILWHKMFSINEINIWLQLLPKLILSVHRHLKDLVIYKPINKFHMLHYQ